MDLLHLLEFDLVAVAVCEALDGQGACALRSTNRAFLELIDSFETTIYRMLVARRYRRGMVRLLEDETYLERFSLLCKAENSSSYVVISSAETTGIHRLDARNNVPAIHLKSTQACVSPDGLRVIDHEKPGFCVVQHLFGARQPQRFELGGQGVVWFSWDESCTTVQFITSSTRFSLDFVSIDISEKTATLILKGFPLFWSQSKTELGKILYRRGPDLGIFNSLTKEQIQLPHLTDEEDESASYQVPVLALDGRICIVRKSSLILCDLQGGNRINMHTFDTLEGNVEFQLTPSGRFCVFSRRIGHGRFLQSPIRVFDMESVTLLAEIEISTALAFYLQGDRFILVLHVVESEHDNNKRDARFCVYDLQTKQRLFSPAVRTSHELMSNRVPFMSAYGLTHSPWHRDGLRFCAVSAETADLLVCKIDPATGPSLSVESHPCPPYATFSWFA